MNILTEIKTFDYKTKKAKYIFSFLIPAVISFILTPGVIFEIRPKEKKKIIIEKKIDYVTALTHSILIGLIMFAAYYFYLGKNCGVLRATI